MKVSICNGSLYSIGIIKVLRYVVFLKYNSRPENTPGNDNKKLSDKDDDLLNVMTWNVKMSRYTVQTRLVCNGLLQNV